MRLTSLRDDLDMAITGAVLALLGAVLVIVATAWELIEVSANRRDLNHSLMKREEWVARWKASEAEWNEGGFLEPLSPDRIDALKAHRNELERELNELDPRENDAFEFVTQADFDRSVLASVWRTLTRQGVVAAFGGLLSVAGAVCSIAAL